METLMFVGAALAIFLTGVGVGIYTNQLVEEFGLAPEDADR